MENEKSEDEIVENAVEEIEEQSEEISDKPSLEEQIEILKQTNKELQDKLLRQMAETENVRSRNIKSTQEARDYSILSFAKDMIVVMDNLSRALEHLPKEMDEKVSNIIEGVKMTHLQLLESFKRNNIDVIEPNIGEKFDYHHHLAISQQQSAEIESGNIIGIMQRGYKIKDRLVRPASVIVAK